MQSDGLQGGPYACSFYTVDVLDDFIFDDGKNVLSLAISLLVDLCSNIYKEGPFLRRSLVRTAHHAS